MANTTNYNWETPDDTDLVKDGAAAIRTLGNSIDTTTKNLNPETTTGDIAYRSATANTNTRLAIGSTGQVLTVAAGVPSWATPTDQTPLTTKGDVFTFSTVDARLGVGANGTVLTADSAETTGLKWAAPAGATFKGVSLYNSTDPTIANNTVTAVAFDTEFYDTDGFHSTVTNNTRVTIPAGLGGKYLITSANVTFNTNATGVRAIRILKNGSVLHFGPTILGNASEFLACNFTTTCQLVATDYIEIAVYQNSGGNLGFYAGDTRALFSVTYLGA